MFLGQSTCVGGFGILLVYRLWIFLSHAMGIIGLHMCSVVGVYFGIDMWGLWDGYWWIVACKFLLRYLLGWLVYCFVYQWWSPRVRFQHSWRLYGLSFWGFFRTFDGISIRPLECDLWYILWWFSWFLYLQFFCDNCYGLNPFSRMCHCSRWVWDVCVLVVSYVIEDGVCLP